MFAVPKRTGSPICYMKNHSWLEIEVANAYDAYSVSDGASLQTGHHAHVIKPFFLSHNHFLHRTS